MSVDRDQIAPMRVARRAPEPVVLHSWRVELFYAAIVMLAVADVVKAVFDNFL